MTPLLSYPNAGLKIKKIEPVIVDTHRDECFVFV